MSKEKRYSLYGTFVIKDLILGETLQVNFRDIHKDMKKDIYSKIEETIKDYGSYIAKDVPPSKKEIDARIKGMREDGWGNRRITNFFAKFGIELNLPSQPRLKKGQQSLPRFSRKTRYGPKKSRRKY